MKFLHRSALVLCAALSMLGCETSDTPADDAAVTPTDAASSDAFMAAADAFVAPDAGPSDAGPQPDAPFPMGSLTITGRVSELSASGMGAVQPDVSVCVVQPMGGPCAISDAGGMFSSMMIPEDTEMLLEFTKPSFFPAIATVTSGTTDVSFNYFIATRATVDLLATLLRTTVDPTRGEIFVQLGMGADAAGLTVSIEPDPGAMAGPYYTMGGIPSRSLMATTEDGTAIFANVPPGDYVVTVTAPAGITCGPTGFAWAGSMPNQSRVPVRADTITSTTLLCAATP